MWNVNSADDGKPASKIRPGRTVFNEYLRRQAVMWPTPRAGRAGRTCKEYNKDRGADLEVTMAKTDPSTVGGQLNPDWVCWLMGFPTGWTDIGE